MVLSCTQNSPYKHAYSFLRFPKCSLCAPEIRPRCISILAWVPVHNSTCLRVQFGVPRSLSWLHGDARALHEWYISIQRQRQPQCHCFSYLAFQLVRSQLFYGPTLLTSCCLQFHAVYNSMPCHAMPCHASHIHARYTTYAIPFCYVLHHPRCPNIYILLHFPSLNLVVPSMLFSKLFQNKEDDGDDDHHHHNIFLPRFASSLPILARILLRACI